MTYDMPKTNAPTVLYIHQEYPKWITDRDGKDRVVNTEEEHLAALEDHPESRVEAALEELDDALTESLEPERTKLGKGRPK